MSGQDERTDRLDLDRSSRAALDFDALLDWVASFARTAPGAQTVRALEPLADLGPVRAELDLIDELRALIDERGPRVPRGLADPGPGLRGLEVEGAAPRVEELASLASVLEASGRIGVELAALSGESFPCLRELGRSLPDLRTEAREVLGGLEPDGRIADRASAGLRAVRASLARVGSRLQTLLESLLHGPDSEAVIRDDFITQRNGRFVIPVRTDAPRPLRGIVHASSSSGATQFVEPLQTVDLNNKLVHLTEREREEEQRVLRRWADGFRSRLVEVIESVDGLAGLDGLQARVLFGEEIGAITPSVTECGKLIYAEVRHPLLDRRLREQGARCTPLSLSLEPAEQVVVLSGPNTGGKTVALKTFGLSVLMAQSGLPVPAAELVMPLYRQLRADIGDHQSIDADLSTYSAHVRSVIDFFDELRPPSLFLFDEIGTGTDPAEGTALARAILEELRRPGMTTMATTHQGALKSWAFVTEGVSCAAMEYDSETLRPTFRILMGAAGASAGLEIAERLGLSASIVDRARKHLGEQGVSGESYMTRLRELTAEAEERRVELVKREADLEANRRRIEERAEAREERRREEATRALDRAVEQLRREARKGLAAIEDRQERRRAEREVGRLESRIAREKVRRSGELGGRTDPAGWREPPAELSEGTRVLVRSLAREGVVDRRRGDRVDVRLGRMTFTVELDDLRVRGASPAPPASDREDVESAPERRPAFPDVADQLVLIGKRVEEAIEELDRYLDAAVLAGRLEVRIVHGHGTGRLRRAVRQHLESHVQVQSRRPGKPYEGGDGATVAVLR